MRGFLAFCLVLFVSGCSITAGETEKRVLGLLGDKNGCVYISGRSMPVPGGSIAVAKGPKAKCSRLGASIDE